MPLPPALLDRNHYLVTPSGRFVGRRGVGGSILLLPLLVGLVVGALGGAIGALLDTPHAPHAPHAPQVFFLSTALGGGAFVAAAAAAWVSLRRSALDLRHAHRQWFAGDTSGRILRLCQEPLGRAFRADIRMRAYYTLALCAEANADFLEAADLFHRAFDSVPAIAAPKWKRRAQCMILARRAVCLVALGRTDEAAAAVDQASAFSPPARSTPLLDALTDHPSLGAFGVAAGLRELESGRNPLGLLMVATVVVLAARGKAREAADLITREGDALQAGFWPREKALLARVEARALTTGGPMRSPGVLESGDDDDDWAALVLPVPAST